VEDQPPGPADIAGTEGDPLPEARELAQGAAAAGLGLKLLGGLAVRVVCPDFPPRLRRDQDIDYACLARGRKDVAAYLERAGCRPDRRFNNLNGDRQMYFHAPSGRPIDVMVDRLTMCHTLDFRPSFARLPLTLDAVDLLLSKLQIVELNAKDARDALQLLGALPVREPGSAGGGGAGGSGLGSGLEDDGPAGGGPAGGSGLGSGLEDDGPAGGGPAGGSGLGSGLEDDGPAGGGPADGGPAGGELASGAGPAPFIDAERFAKVLGGDWGWWRTVTGNLAKFPPLASDSPQLLPPDPPFDPLAQARRLLELADAAPKGVKWRLRANIGDRVRWYELPEEVGH